jgi:hypothetical protein
MLILFTSKMSACGTIFFSTEGICWHSTASQCDLYKDIRHTMALFCLFLECTDTVHSIYENKSA